MDFWTTKDESDLFIYSSTKFDDKNELKINVVIVIIYVYLRYYCILVNKFTIHDSPSIVKR